MTDIAGATSSTYTLVSADLGQVISVKVTATNSAGSANANAANVGPVTAAPANTAPPVISGALLVGNTLTTTDGSWTGTPAPAFSYQWKSGGTNVGTNANTYTLVTGDLGATMTVVVTATNSAGSANATSVGVGPITSSGSNGWQPLLIGNGGVVSRVSIANDGTLAVGTDTNGAFIWSPAQNKFISFFTATKMPVGAIIDGDATVGVEEVVIDPGNSSNIWMMYTGNLYKSVNGGASFTAVSTFPTQPNSTNLANSSPQKAWGPYIAIDPNNSSVVYVSTYSRGCWFSNDAGASWNCVVQVSAGLPPNINSSNAFPATSGTNSTDSISVGTGTKTFGHNSGAFGFSGGYVQVWRTSDPSQQMIGTAVSTGTTFVLTASQSFGSGSYTDWSVGIVNAYGSGHRICFDVSNGTTTVGGQTRTANVFIATSGVGFFKSTTGGYGGTGGFVIQNATGMPLTCRTMACDPYGVLWTANDDYPGTTNAKKYDGSTWTTLTATGANWYDSVAIDVAQSPAKASTHVALIQGDQAIITLSTDGGANWHNSGGTGHRLYYAGGDVDWLLSYFTAQPNAFFGSSQAKFDPTHTGRLYGGAEGLWYSVPTTGSADITLTQQTRGIEEFIAIRIVAPPGGGILLGSWDFPLFYQTVGTAGTYPAAMAGADGGSITPLQRGYSIDWVWNSPTTVVALALDGFGGGSNASARNRSCISSSGGSPGSWSLLPTRLTVGGNAGGCIAAASTTTFVWVQAGTADVPTEPPPRGSTWLPISIPGGTPTTFWGASTDYFTNVQVMDSDKTNGDIYLYNVNDGVTGDMIYRRAASGGTLIIQVIPILALNITTN